MIMDINKVNKLNFLDFTTTFENLVEHCPIIPASIWSRHPFKDREEIFTHIVDTIDGLSTECEYNFSHLLTRIFIRL